MVLVAQAQVLLTGRCAAQPQPEGTLTAVVTGLWRTRSDSTSAREQRQGTPPGNWVPVEMTDPSASGWVLEEVRRVLSHVPGLSGSAAADLDGAATVIAKALAEKSRSTVADLRELRYALERDLGRALRPGGTQEVDPILADIVELSTICGRATDQARESYRAGLWTWRTDDLAYHAQRRMMDRTLPEWKGSGDGADRSWFLVYDAGVRQCRSMCDLLTEEGRLLQGLLSAASTIAVTRGARAQEVFNVVATTGATLFSIPALVIALYGATSVLPAGRTNIAVFVPMLVGGLAAAGVVALLPSRSTHGRWSQFWYTAGAVVAIVILLFCAGTLVHPKT